MNRWLFAPSGLLLLFIPACQAQQAEVPQTAPPAASATSAPTGAVVARVNGAEIRAQQVEQVLRLTMARAGQDPAAVPADQMTHLRTQYLDSLINAELLYQASQKAGIQVDEKEVDGKIQVLRSQYPSEEEFQRSTKQDGMSVDDMRERIRRNLATEELVKKKVDPQVKVTDADIADYFTKNKDRFRRPELVRLSQIFVKLDPRSGPEARTAARQKIESLQKELRKGADFAALARQQSEAPDAAQGGDMGYLSRSAPMPVIVDAAFKLKVGETSDVVETPHGYHLFRATEKKAAGDVKLAEAKSQISELLFQQKEREALNAFVAQLKAGAKIEVLAPTP